MITIITPLILGSIFGFALSKGGLTRYTNISGVFRFTNLTVIKFMLTALGVAALGIAVLETFGGFQAPAAPATYMLGNLVGGLVFGVGMSLAGYCPGTCAAGSGEGKLDYLIPGLFGLIVGGILFGFAYPSFMPALLKVGNLGNTSLPALLNADPVLVAALLGILILLLFYFLERGLKRKDSLES